MRNDQLPATDRCWEGAKVALANSKNLRRISGDVGDNKDYGAALSLLVLGSEEAVKA